MAIVTGVLADFGRSALSRNAQIEFHPSGNASKAAGSVLYATRPITTTPNAANGKWSVDLETTDFLHPETWYEIVILWSDAANNYVSKDFVPGRLYVPPIGGAFTDLYRVKPNGLEVWIASATSVPVDASALDLLFDPETDNLYKVN